MLYLRLPSPSREAVAMVGLKLESYCNTNIQYALTKLYIHILQNTVVLGNGF